MICLLRRSYWQKRRNRWHLNERFDQFLLNHVHANFIRMSKKGQDWIRLYCVVLQSESTLFGPHDSSRVAESDLMELSSHGRSNMVHFTELNISLLFLKAKLITYFYHRHDLGVHPRTSYFIFNASLLNNGHAGKWTLVLRTDTVLYVLFSPTPSTLVFMFSVLQCSCCMVQVCWELIRQYNCVPEDCGWKDWWKCTFVLLF